MKLPHLFKMWSKEYSKVQGFRTFAFSHTKRQGNAPAHTLAQHAVNVEDFLVWLEECLGCIMHACMQDVRAFSIYE